MSYYFRWEMQPGQIFYVKYTGNRRKRAINAFVR